MAYLLMPNVGEGIAEGAVVRWLKHAGDAVTADDPIVEVETDKAVVEVPSPFTGTLTRILVDEGESVAVGAPLAEFALAVQPVAEPDRSTAAGAEPPAPAAPPASASASPRSSSAATAGRAEAPPLSPVVLRLAAEYDVDLRAVAGSGAGGRVTRQDVLRHVAQRDANADVAPASPAASAMEAPTSAPPAAPGLPQLRAGEPELVRLTPTRRTVARRMTESHATIPVAWMAIEADVTPLVAARERLKERFAQRHGVALTYFPFLTHSIVAVLQQHRRLNATFTDDGLRVHADFEIGIAVATEAGLVVPVVHHADRLALGELALRIAELAERARARRLSVEDVRGGTFTIDNTGAFGSIVSQPIVPPGQVAIVTTEAIRRLPRFLPDDALAPRSVMQLAISFDHRALDGADVGAFMRDLRLHLEAFDPELSTI